MTGGDRPDFAQVYDEQIWRVYGFFAYRVRSRSDAEDLTQLTFERAWRAWRRYDASRATATTWVMAIARNLLIDHYRHSAVRRADPLDDEAIEAAVGAEEPVGEGADPDLLDAIARLGDREKEMLALRFGGDLTAAEIAAVTGHTLANVQQILSRTLRRLRDELRHLEPATPVAGRPAPGSGGERTGAGEADARDQE